MIARSHEFGALSTGSPVCSRDPRAMPPEARLAEVAQLLARAYLRATCRDTARPAADVTKNENSETSELGPKALALSPEPEPACGHARAPGRTRTPTADHAQETNQ